MDLLIGTGGAPEGVLAAAGLKCLGGDFQGQLVFKDKKEEERALEAGVKDLHKVWPCHELVKGEALFCATGVTSGDLLPGIRETNNSSFVTHSLILSSKNQWKLVNYHHSSAHTE